MSALILYDTTGQWGYLGELYGIMAANLVSRFGGWTAKPVAQYTAGQVNQFTATIYIGSTYDEPIPTAFLDDVLTATKPVIWIADNIWQLTARLSTDSFVFRNKYGWVWAGFDTSPVATVNYKGQALSRYADNAAGIMNYSLLPQGNGAPTVLATAVRRSDNSTFPWALRSASSPASNLTYIGENPLVYITEGDRYLAFCDLLFDALAPATPTQHRGLVRLEDISPVSDPSDITTKVDYLFSKGVPFGMTLSPLYKDPLGFYNNGVAQTVRLRNAPDVIAALKYAQSKGGVIVEHGWTHQYSNIHNAYDGVSGDDFEFFRVTENADHTWNFVGPLPESTSTAWATGRITSSGNEFQAAGLPIPTIWTFPHYFGGPFDYKAATAKFGARYERCLYYKGLLSGGPIDSTRYAGQYVPFVVRDVYGSKVLPDNLGGIEPDAFFQFPPRLPQQVIDDARRNLVVRDGFASFFCFHGNDISLLKTTVEGIMSLGYTFVSPGSL
jgi:uncharacterized protein YdaL